MKTRLPSARRHSTARSQAVAAPQLRWIHDGMRHRVILSSELRFEREVAPDEWHAAELADEVFASTPLVISGAAWRDFLAYLPGAVRDFVGRYAFGRMAALHVVTRCPTLLADLERTPALTAFVAAHHALRGGDRPAWSEITAVHEREGTFGLLQWLGLPASPQTLMILQHIADPDLPCRLLQPLRSALWEPEAIWMLSRSPALTDEQLVQACHALAA